MDYKEIYEHIGTLMEEDYKSFIMALISIEKGIEDREVLEKIYDKYMDDDDLTLLNESLFK